MHQHANPHHVALEASEVSPEVVEARQFIRSGQIDSAIALLEPLANEGSDDYQIYEVIGAAYGQKGDMQRAAEWFRKAAHVNPAQPHIYFNLGQALLRLKDLPGAKEAMERALRIDPTYARAREALAALLKPQDQG